MNFYFHKKRLLKSYANVQLTIFCSDHHLMYRFYNVANKLITTVKRSKQLKMLFQLFSSVVAVCSDFFMQMTFFKP